jgi:thiamine pyrophosphate-dependent acetolactate synthase large subunit-like protein
MRWFRVGMIFVLGKHENAAGFMAEGVQHAIRAPVILLATLGLGVANAVNVVVNALQDQVPLIVLTGCAEAAEALTFTHQVFDHQALLRPITKASFRAVADQSDILVDKAVAIALEGRPGPVIPISRSALSAHRIDRPPGCAGPRPEQSCRRPLLDEARALFQRNIRPALVIGIDAIHEEGGGASIRDFAEQATRQEASFPKTAHHRAAALLHPGAGWSLGLLLLLNTASKAPMHHVAAPWRRTSRIIAFRDAKVDHFRSMLAFLASTINLSRACLT